MENDFFVSVDRGAIAIAIVTGSVLVINQLVRMRRVSMLHKTIREALNSGSPLAPALIDKLDEKPSYKHDERTGTILVALAIGLILFSLVQGGSPAARSFIAVAMFPAVLGAALFARAWLAGRKDRSS